MPKPSEPSGAQLDVAALYRALDIKRASKALSWRQVASQAGVSPSTLTRMGQGKRPDVDSFAGLVRWLGVPSDEFLTGTSARPPRQNAVTVLSTHLRASKELSPKSARALEDIIKAAYAGLKAREDGR